MNSQPFKRFIDLITFDQQIHAAQQEIKSLEKDIASYEHDIKGKLVELEKVKASTQKAKKEVDAKELEMKSLDEKEKEAQRKLESAQDHKEYVSLKKEIEHLKAKQHEFEDILVAAWHQFETWEKEYKHKQTSYNESTDLLQQQVEAKKSKVAEHRSVLDRLNQEREQHIVGIPAEWLDKYAVMRSKISNPVVPVKDGHCSACYYKIPSQDLMGLRRRKLLQCKDCYRLLYIEGAEVENDEAHEHEAA